jgi:hypothetical protein
MKKLISLALALLLCVSLFTGCSTIMDQISDVIGESKEEQISVTRGTWSDNIYSNDYMDLVYTQPEGWAQSTDKQMADLFNLGSSSLTDEGKIDYNLEKDQNIYDMLSMDPLSGDSVAVMYEKLLVDISMAAYLTIVKLQIAPEDPNDDVNYIDEGTITIAEKEYNFFEIEHISSGAHQTYAIRAIEDHMTIILITDANPDANSKENILESFSLLTD